jgi:predicted amidohydrolase
MRLALLQMTARAGDVPANLARIDDAMRAAAARGADLLLAPELALSGYGAGAAIADLADPPGGPQRAALARMAREHGLAIVAGLAEAAEGAIWNSAYFTDGAADAIYRKSHLYGAYETALFRPGPPAAVTFAHAGLTCGMLICYDVEFPENVRRLAQAGADLVLVPTALPAAPFTQFIARRIIPVRAFENQVFVAYANHGGADERFTYQGMSCVAAPDGSILAEAGGPDAHEAGAGAGTGAGAQDALLIVDIDPAAYGASRADNAYLRDLRV